MNNNHSSKFMDGLVLGAMLGGALVFLLGTRTGKNLLKIVSEQGLDGLANLLEEYDLGDIEDEEEDIEEPAPSSNGHAKPHEENVEDEEVKEVPKRRFFKRIRR